jgi:hypothetical protein
MVSDFESIVVTPRAGTRAIIRVEMRIPVPLAVVAVVGLALAPGAFAQSMHGQLNQTARGAAAAPRSHVTRPTPPARPPAPPPAQPQTIAPPITYPFPPLMTPPAGGLLPRAGEGVPFRTRAPRGGYGYGGYFYAPGYGDYYTDTTDPSRSRLAAPVPTTGLLRLAVTPLSAEVFVDSLYVGTVADINARNVLELSEGAHRIEIRAPQYQTVTVDVRITPYETVTYRATLEPLRPAAAAPAPPAPGPATTMYVIPNCYLGNVPPRPDRLPSGCDAKQVHVVGPK